MRTLTPANIRPAQQTSGPLTRRSLINKAGAESSLDVVAKLTAIGDQFAKTEGTFTAQRADSLAEVVVIARKLATDTDAWLDFCNAEYWKSRTRDKPKVDSPSKVLLRCFQMVMNAEEPTQKVAASRFAKALDRCFESDQPKDEIAQEIISSGGIDGLLKKRKASRDHICIWLDPDQYEETIQKIRNSEVGSICRIATEVASEQSGEKWLTFKAIVSPKSAVR